MKVLSTILFVFFTLSVLGKGINMKFIVKVDRHIYYTLNLKKDNTYKYISYSISLGTKSTLDSGIYQLIDNIIIFNSKDLQSNDNFDNKKFYFKERKIKSYESEYVNSIIYSIKKTLFSSKIIALLSNSNDSIVLRSNKPSDNIQVNVFNPSTSIKQWVIDNVLPNYQFSISELDSSHWTNMFESKELNILAVDSKWALKCIYFQIKDKVYYSNYPRLDEYNKPLLDKCFDEKLINTKQKKEIAYMIKLFNRKH